MKNFHQPLFTCCLLLSFLGLSFSPIQQNIVENGREVIIKITIQVDMQYEEVHPEGVYLSCNILNGYVKTKMEKVSSSTWSITFDSPIGYEVLFKFLNGPDTWEPNGALEECSIDGGFDSIIRTWITGSTDVVLPVFCYGYCISCDLVSSDRTTLLDKAISIFPNPAADQVSVAYQFPAVEHLSFRLRDAAGRLVRFNDLGNVSAGQYEMSLEGLAKGLYWMEFYIGDQRVSKKFMVGQGQ